MYVAVALFEKYFKLSFKSVILIECQLEISAIAQQIWLIPEKIKPNNFFLYLNYSKMQTLAGK